MHPQSARESCSFFLARLSAEVARLRAQPFPGHHIGPRKWLNFIQGIVDSGQAHLEESGKPGLSTNDSVHLIAEAERLGGAAYRFMQHVAGADASQIPHQIVAPFQRIVERLGINSTIFFRSEHLPNYELGTYASGKAFKTFKYATPSLIKAHDAIDWPMLIVTVPGHAMGMLPHFAVVGHELGHAIEDKIKATLDFSSKNAEIAQCKTDLHARFKTAGVPIDTAAQVKLKSITSSWFNEIIADAIGYWLGGPAFFFALCGFIQLSTKSYGIGQTHPPTDLRRQLLLQQMSSGASSFVDVFKNQTGLQIAEDTNSPGIPKCPPSDQLFAELVSKFPALDAVICTQQIEYLKVVGPLIYDSGRQYMEANCPELIYTPERLESDLTNHLDALCKLIPPIETLDVNGATPASLSTILNVGWAALLTRLDKLTAPAGKSGDATASKMERLHELLLKATELSEARRLWEEMK